jgi:WD40 repeat protein
MATKDLKGALQGVWLRHRLKGRAGPMLNAAWLSGGAMLGTVTTEGVVEIWDAITGAPAPEVRAAVAGTMAWSPDGLRLAQGFADRNDALSDPHSGDVRLWLHGQAGVVRSLAWSPDGRTLAAGSDQGSVSLWDLDRDDGAVRLVLHGHFVAPKGAILGNIL